LERIAMYLQDVDDVYLVEWAPGVPYGRVRKEEEYELSRYSFELADTDLHRRLFDDALKEGWRLLNLEDASGAKDTRTVLPAYDWALKASHAFNVLDARGAISVSQRAGMILGIRKLSCAIAARYVGTDAAPPAAPAETARG
ncbi:MAG TPA: glycine--tRNA ligase subunit alpha, partial [Vicinamibacteria bacterium]|nr:glycine--tRNA ligase subunit alpha [Vicinamibacteria bacterium]